MSSTVASDVGIDEVGLFDKALSNMEVTNLNQAAGRN